MGLLDIWIKLVLNTCGVLNRSMIKNNQNISELFFITWDQKVLFPLFCKSHTKPVSIAGSVTFSCSIIHEKRFKEGLSSQRQPFQCLWPDYGPPLSSGVTAAVWPNGIARSLSWDPCHGTEMLWMVSRFLLHIILISLESFHIAFSSTCHDLQIIALLWNAAGEILN